MVDAEFSVTMAPDRIHKGMAVEEPHYQYPRLVLNLIRD